ncbi:hypothetical protein KBY55_26760 [Streptomyces sp. b94]|uniref:hypothetical protein n=1 Tax=Streptomyces sp. b94 TaxID=1827634 RepID=UPI001B3743B6|nr:hypothetical protein [Streptomyces sp. b94]MBQ1099565.1 hypothetical protein [Streptomyces sp. b94]
MHSAHGCPAGGAAITAGGRSALDHRLEGVAHVRVRGRDGPGGRGRRARSGRTLVVEPFDRLAEAYKDEVAAEGERAPATMHPGAAYDVRFGTVRE